MYDFRKLKFNPVWLAIGAIWIQHLIIGFDISEVAKILLITAVLVVQVYFVYLGVERLNKEKTEKSTKRNRKKK